METDNKKYRIREGILFYMPNTSLYKSEEHSIKHCRSECYPCFLWSRTRHCLSVSLLSDDHRIVSRLRCRHGQPKVTEDTRVRYQLEWRREPIVHGNIDIVTSDREANACAHQYMPVHGEKSGDIVTSHLEEI